jgi:hypothetical protein
MKEYKELNLGFGDAENYKKREHKALLNKFFIKTDEIHRLLEPTKYFLVGDKGTGKTAFALYLTNNEYLNTVSFINYIRETEYVKFVTLKNEKHLTLTEYVSIWKILIYLLLSQQITKAERESIFSTKKYKALIDAINEFYKSAFSPEIIYALNIIDDSKLAAEILHKYFKLSGEDKHSETFSESRFQINLLYIQKKFEDAFSSINLDKNHILFIDGIDIRPRNIPYESYLECIKGLANAVWAINNDFFSKIKGSKGKLKVALLVRPDIFAHLGLQNSNNKIRDNSVLLDWRTSYRIFKKSAIFNLSDNLLNSQQETLRELGGAWDYYFPFSPFVAGKNENSFVSFLRYSMSKPRDIITMMKILQEDMKNDLERNIPVIDQSDFDSSSFKSKYSDYLLGEIKDFLSFYHSDKEYELFLKFFEFLNGKSSFDYDYYMDTYDNFAEFIEKNKIDVPVFFESSDKFLQFLFELNVICYIEETHDKEPMIHWCYRERTYSNLNPKVKEGVRYLIHYGLQKSLNTGKELRRRVITQSRNITNI